MKAGNNVPNHVVIIPDGNRRWAKDRGLKPWDGHREGAENMERLTRKALDLGIRYFSFWGSSLENLAKRPLMERKALLDIYEQYTKKLIDAPDIHDNRVRLNFIGRWENQFPSGLKKIIREAIGRTRSYDKHFLNFFLAYSGDDEMVEAVKKITRSGIRPEKISAKTIKENLFTSELPPVDLLIRTGGDPHLSAGFMMWDIAESQLFFSEKYFPDFGSDDLEKAVREYQRRERRHGK
jgi:tritrans,polycis-undecaprenyl-diphosphate synthase [geranylgeranyl-diphosphate specific]